MSKHTPGKMTSSPLKICPQCRGENVQELLLVWHRSNDGQRVEDEWNVAELYSEPFYCEDCDKTLTSLDEKAGGENSRD
jgi:uncharacterized protein YbaR (Trm112 family)